MGLGMFEQADTEPVRPRLPESVEAWARNLFDTQHADPSTNCGVLTFGPDHEDPAAIAIFVAPDTDLSDAEMYPSEFEGVRCVYRHLPVPEAY